MMRFSPPIGMFITTKNKKSDCIEKLLGGDEYNPIGRVFFFSGNCPFSSRVFLPDLLRKNGNRVSAEYNGLALNIKGMQPWIFPMISGS